MGTVAHVVVHGDPALADRAVAEIERLEQRWSRFLPTSEISALNRGAGTWVDVSPETLELVQRAVQAAEVTGHRYDPTVLGDVLRAGYDRPFDRIVVTTRTTSPSSALRRGVDRIEIDAEAAAVRLPGLVGIDPGGIGKGLAADLVTRLLERERVAGALVNIGGDLRAIGVGPDGEDWTVDLDPVAAGHPLARVVLDHGAVATSTTMRRRWRIGAARRHHLIDPSTGQPSETDVVAATVLAAEGWQAEVLAKASILAGLDEAPALLASVGADALLVDHHGGLHPTAGFDRFRADARVPEEVRS